MTFYGNKAGFNFARRSNLRKINIELTLLTADADQQSTSTLLLCLVSD